jgi:molybdopterin-containing oxidoreductase family iron-sulfur binding subunit
MEKCSFCIQRINAARIEIKVRDLKDKDGNYLVPDGFLQTACQQACPSDAIVFGDLLDKTSNKGAGSLARQMRDNQRSYLLLGYLNTRPRTTHMIRVANPNPRLALAERRKHWDNPFHHGGGHEGEGREGGGRSEGAKDAHAMSRSTFLRDSAKRLADRGYALSLKVLSV